MNCLSLLMPRPISVGSLLPPGKRTQLSTVATASNDKYGVKCYAVCFIVKA